MRDSALLLLIDSQMPMNLKDPLSSSQGMHLLFCSVDCDAAGACFLYIEWRGPCTENRPCAEILHAWLDENIFLCLLDRQEDFYLGLLQLFKITLRQNEKVTLNETVARLAPHLHRTAPQVKSTLPEQVQALDASSRGARKVAPLFNCQITCFLQ